MKKLLFVLMLCLFSTQAKAGEIKPGVIVNIHPIQYDFTKTSKELTIMAGVSNGVVMGMVHPETKVGVSYNLDETTGEMTEFNLVIDLYHTLYVTNEFENGSCMYHGVFVHEMKHVLIQYEVVEEFHKYFLNDMKAVLSVDRPDIVQRAYLKGVLVDRLQDMFAVTMSRQQQHDSHSEYYRVSNRC